jgi:hypothetical protein
VEAEASKYVSARGELGADQRKKEIDAYLLQVLEENSETQSEVIEDPGRATYLLNGKDLILKFHKRGYSKMEEVEEYFDCVHIVPVGQVAEFLHVHPNAIPVTLPDMVSTIMFPEAVWAMAEPGPLSNPSANKLGFINKSASTFDDLYKLILLMQLSSAFHFMDSLGAQSPTSNSAHLEKVCAKLQESTDTTVLPRKGGNRQAVLEFISSKVIGGSYGVNVVAARSNQGARTSRKLNANSGYVTSILQGPMLISEDDVSELKSLDYFTTLLQGANTSEFVEDVTVLDLVVDELTQT